MSTEATRERARGQWRGILQTLGIPGERLVNRHGPCPVCGGKDRFRFDDKGTGRYFCSGSCGPGDGLDLVQRFLNCDFSTAAQRVDQILHNVRQPLPRADEPKPEMTEEQRRDNLRALWKAASPIGEDSPLWTYLRARKLEEVDLTRDIRFGTGIRDGEGGLRPCMVALVRDASGEPVTMHRTFLRQDCRDKAEMPSPRKMMPGPVPDGAHVRLMAWEPGGPLGIAEGIETAIAASIRFGLPVWSAINAGNLAKFRWPEGCEERYVFGDNDTKFAGQAAAYELARRSVGEGISVSVHIPDLAGKDWADLVGLPI